VATQLEAEATASMRPRTRPLWGLNIAEKHTRVKRHSGYVLQVQPFWIQHAKTVDGNSVWMCWAVGPSYIRDCWACRSWAVPLLKSGLMLSAYSI